MNTGPIFREGHDLITSKICRPVALALLFSMVLSAWNQMHVLPQCLRVCKEEALVLIVYDASPMFSNTCNVPLAGTRSDMSSTLPPRLARGPCSPTATYALQVVPGARPKQCLMPSASHIPG
jgi:hypothetical protein